MDFYLKSASEKLYMVRNPEGFYYLANTINEEILSIQGVVYSIVILIVLKNYKERIVDFYAGVNQPFLRWMRIGVILTLIAWVLGIIGTIVERAQIDIGIDLFTFVYLFFVVIIYGISYAALRSGEVYKLKTEHVSELIGLDNFETDTYSAPLKTSEPGPNKIIDLSQQEEEFENELNERLISFMENSKPYLNPDISLQSLAEDLSVSRHQLSATINSRQKMNFFEFVNHYRVKEVKDLMEKDGDRKTKNYKLAYDAGFNSKATFYRIFKQFSGHTPSDYRESIIKTE
jgi:AraC-like DNA-binding protein